MSAAALAAVERELERWEWQNRLDQRPKTYLGEEATTLLVEYTGIIYLRVRLISRLTQAISRLLVTCNGGHNAISVA